MNRAGKLHNLWIIAASSYATAKLCIKGILKVSFGNFNRAWENKVTMQWSNRILNLVKVKLKIVNPNKVEPKKGNPTILMCNHTSLYDIPLSFQIFPDHTVHMLAKKELSKIPFMGTAMNKVGYPFIDRKDKQKAKKDLMVVQELLQKDIVIWIAPEGTRSKNGKLNRFKKGGFITAIQTQATIIPIGIRGAHKILPKKALSIYLNCQPEIHIGKPIDASKYTLDNKDELITTVYERMKQLVGPEQA